MYNLGVIDGQTLRCQNKIIKQIESSILMNYFLRGRPSPQMGIFQLIFPQSIRFHRHG